ncbi:MAG: hypothetical protein KDJ27_10435 [Gammaproteobacteria bacterium]|nr:hypothetical protein [Gammaproteobacteria bacterium]
MKMRSYPSLRSANSLSVLLAATILASTALTGCVNVASEEERLAALAAEPLSPDYRVAMLAAWLSPPYRELVELVDEQQLDAFGADIASGFSQRLPASVAAWPAPYGRRTAVGQHVLSAGAINEYARSQMPIAARGGFDAMMTVVLKPVAGVRTPDSFHYGGVKTVRTTGAPGGSSESDPFSVEVKQNDGHFKLIEREFQLKAMRAYVNIRTVPGDALLYFDSNVEVACEEAEKLRSSVPDSRAAVADCAVRLSEQLASNLERTLRRIGR